MALQKYCGRHCVGDNGTIKKFLMLGLGLCSSVVEHMPGMHEALGLIPDADTKRREGKGRKWGEGGVDVKLVFATIIKVTWSTDWKDVV